MQLPISVLKIINEENKKYKNHIQQIKGDEEWPYHVVAKRIKNYPFFFKVQIAKDVKSTSSEPVVKIIYQPTTEDKPSATATTMLIRKFRELYQYWLELLLKAEAVLLEEEELTGIEPEDGLELQRVRTSNYIKELRIEDFKNITGLELSLIHKLNIFLGRNGSGKTGLLQALSLALIPDNNLDKKDDFKDYIYLGKRRGAIEVQREDEIKKIYVLSNEKISNVIGGTFRLKADYSNEPFVLAYGSNIFSGEIDYAQRARDMIEGNDKWYFVKSLFEDFSPNFPDPLELLYNLNEYRGNEKYHAQREELDEIIAFMVQKLNEFIQDTFTIELEVTSYSFVSKQGHRLKTAQLSEGYRNNVLLLTDMITRIIALRHELKKFLGDETLSLAAVFQQAKGVIAIDEFDRHLHPSWQRKFVKQLTTLLPRVQFFLTTHNPLAVLDREQGEVQKLIVQEDGTLKAETSELATKDMDVALVLFDYFEMDSVISKHLQEGIDNYYKQLLEGASEESLQELKKDLSASHTGITIPDRKYLTYLRFLQQHHIDPFEEAKAIEKLTPEQIEELKNLL
jgi:predicted ATP-binding protein involved in virulence